MYSSCPLCFGRHKSKYFYYQITFYMCYTCCRKDKYHGGGTAEIKRKCIKRRLKIIGKLSFSLSRFYFLFSFLMQLSKCIHHVRCILADINQNVSITKLHFICETSIKTNITEDELQK